MDGPPGRSRSGSKSPTPSSKNTAAGALDRRPINNGRGNNANPSTPTKTSSAVTQLTPHSLGRNEIGEISGVSPINPFDSSHDDDGINDNNDAGNISPMNPFGERNEPGNDMSSSFISPTATPINPFDSPENEGGGGSDELIESKRRLDDVFRNESDQDQEQSIVIDNHAGDGERAKGTTHEVDAACDDDDNDKNRGTTSTRGSTVWDENAPYSDDDSSHDDEQSVWDTRWGFCLLRLLHRMCRPRIHPPCVGNLSHPHLPKCLERIPPQRRRIICRVLIIIFMIITITFTLLDLLILHRYLHVWLDSTLAWLSEHPAAGGVAFVGVFLIGSLCFFPVALLTLGAGYVYIDLYGLRLGIVVAFVVCYFGYLIGAAVCFARSRYLMRQLIIKFSVKYPIVRAVDRAFETKGLRLFLLLRLSSMPFNALNYIGGITSIKFHDYWWATCAGTIPSLLWTIFVGATFGTINAKGVDGHKEFESTAVRKGLVLGLGIGLGVMGLIGTTIYARKELTKIVLEEQRQRALEEQASVELSQHLIDGEYNTEVGDDGSLSFIDMENPQLGESVDDNLFQARDSERSRNASPHPRDGLESSAHRSDSSSPLGWPRRKKRSQWTPETVAAQLPILPKVINRCISPIVSFDLDASITKKRTSEVEAPGDDGQLQQTGSIRKNRHASMPPITGQCDDSFDSIESGEGYSSVEKTSPTSATRRHTVHSPDNIKLALASSWDAADQQSRARANSSTVVDDALMGLADIDETKVLSDDDASKEANASHLSLTPIANSKDIANRRRCNTDPTGEHGPASAAVMALNDAEAKEYLPTSSRKKRQQLPSWTPTKQGLRKRHSFGSFGAWQTEEERQSSTSASSAGKNRRAPSPSQEPYQEQRGRLRSSSVPFQLTASGNHIELDIGNADSDEGDEGPSREWFWIWA